MVGGRSGWAWLDDDSVVNLKIPGSNPGLGVLFFPIFFAFYSLTASDDPVRQGKGRFEAVGSVSSQHLRPIDRLLVECVPSLSVCPTRLIMPCYVKSDRQGQETTTLADNEIASSCCHWLPFSAIAFMMLV